jgi:hypothetical protein
MLGDDVLGNDIVGAFHLNEYGAETHLLEARAVPFGKAVPCGKKKLARGKEYRSPQ